MFWTLGNTLKSKSERPTGHSAAGSRDSANHRRRPCPAVHRRRSVRYHRGSLRAQPQRAAGVPENQWNSLRHLRFRFRQSIRARIRGHHPSASHNPDQRNRPRIPGGPRTRPYPRMPQLPRSPALKTRRNLHPRRAESVTPPRHRRQKQGPIMKKPTRYAIENKSRAQSARNAR